MKTKPETASKAARAPRKRAPATKFELVINLKSAKALGITIPQSVRLQATGVID